MKNIFCLIFLMFTFLSCSEEKKKKSKPNIIYFLADDLGYGELGAYGQDIIRTPNIDALAKTGMKFTQHYSGAPVCAPARCILLTGKHAGHAYIRGNDEWNERGDVWNYEQACKDPSLEGQRPLPSETITIGKQLKKAGYRTGVFGKWGLGAPGSDGVPSQQGFDAFYGYNCQRQAHNLYPPHLWENEKKVKLENQVIDPMTKLPTEADPYELESYRDFRQKDYGPAAIHEKAKAFIRSNQSEPFFLYYASPLPHLPLQVPDEFAEAYKKTFGEEEPYIGDDSYFPNRYPRASYAGMITYLDYQLGELIALLKELNLYEDTIIMFSSDNGPTYLGGVDFEHFESSKPFSNGYGRTKGFVYEGGIRVPFIASWPNHIESGTTSDHVSAFYDIMPTLCDFAGVEHPADIDGISLRPTLLGQEQLAHDYLYWEFPSYKGQQAVRMGKWKAIRKNIFEGNMTIELYNVDADVKETNDVAKQHPEIVQKVIEIMKKEHTPAVNEKFKFTELGDI